MDIVFQKTRELGQALLETEAYRNMKAAEDKALKNELAAATMTEYLEKRTRIQELLSQNDPDQIELKNLSNDMDELQQKLNMIDDILELTQAQNEFNGLISQINQVLQFIVTGRIDNAEGGCTGSCSTCGGCHGVN